MIENFNSWFLFFAALSYLLILNFVLGRYIFLPKIYKVKVVIFIFECLNFCNGTNEHLVKNNGH
jgi:hypothetical protein